MAKSDAYKKLTDLSRKNAITQSIGNLLQWDQETYMPKQGIALRAPQLELIASLAHKQKTSPAFAKTLGGLINLQSGEIHDHSLTSRQKAALREWRRDYLQLAKIPSSFVKNFAKTTAHSVHVWAQAKSEDNFKMFAPHLEKIVSLMRKKADLLGYTEHPYDALLDQFEPEMKTSTITPLFSRLKVALTNLLKQIQTAAPVDDEFLRIFYDPNKQMHFGHVLLEAMGFDPETSRLDQTAHPFCTPLHPKDTRLTTHIYPRRVMSNIFSCIHEGGHGLYHEGLPEEEFGTPLGEAASYGIDESQSRWWETRIGRSHSFWKYFYPKLQAEFPEQLGGVYLDNFHRAINKVEPSLIRVEADEVTYSLHVIVRFEIEKGLIEGTIKVKQIPEIWNEKMRDYIGIAPETNREGCLQDIHWSIGAIGYFPTYTLGNLYTSQFFETFEKQHPDWKDRVSKGELSFIREWLKEHIHRYGREYTPEALVHKVTGRGLDEKPFIHYLTSKYHALHAI